MGQSLAFVHDPSCQIAMADTEHLYALPFVIDSCHTWSAPLSQQNSLRLVDIRKHFGAEEEQLC
jgi:hypothetical protein